MEFGKYCHKNIYAIESESLVHIYKTIRYFLMLIIIVSPNQNLIALTALLLVRIKTELGLLEVFKETYPDKVGLTVLQSNGSATFKTF
jgi:hypothetical protein